MKEKTLHCSIPYSVIVYIDLGLRQPRLEGEEYLSVVDEFMEAVHVRWPKAVVQVCLLYGYALSACSVMLHF
jgi:hypothetical protein